MRVLLLALMLLAMRPLLAAEPATVFVEDMTWTEVRDAVKAGKTTILIPVGGTEQNGPHMVLGKHNARAKILAGKIAVALGNALVAPVMAYVPEGGIDPPTAHMKFPGTITLPPATFEKVVEYAARSFKQHGFRDIVLLGDHGGYQRDLKAVSDRLNREWAATPVRVNAGGEYYSATEAFADALKHRGYTEAEIGTHAGLADTSLALAIDPRLVRVERLKAGSPATSAEGVQGDPRRSSADLGQVGVDIIVARTVDAIRKNSARR